MCELVFLGLIIFLMYRSDKKKAKREHGISKYSFRDFLDGKWQ